MKRSSDSSRSTEKSQISSFQYEQDGGSARQVSMTSFFAAKPKQRTRKRTSSSVLHESVSCNKQNTSSASAGSSQSAPASPVKASCMSSASQSQSNHKRNKNHQQTYLDFGQLNFGKRTLCQTCGMLFDERLEDDSKQHSRICLDFVRGVPFQAEAPRIVASFGKDTAVIEVRRMDETNRHVGVGLIRSPWSSNLRFDQPTTTAHGIKSRKYEPSSTLSWVSCLPKVATMNCSAGRTFTLFRSESLDWQWPSISVMLSLSSTATLSAVKKRKRRC